MRTSKFLNSDVRFQSEWHGHVPGECTVWYRVLVFRKHEFAIGWDKRQRLFARPSLEPCVSHQPIVRGAENRQYLPYTGVKGTVGHDVGIRKAQQQIRHACHHPGY